jgi:hypothetical protein
VAVEGDNLTDKLKQRVAVEGDNLTDITCKQINSDNVNKRPETEGKQEQDLRLGVRVAWALKCFECRPAR